MHKTGTKQWVCWEPREHGTQRLKINKDIWSPFAEMNVRFKNIFTTSSFCCSSTHLNIQTSRVYRCVSQYGAAQRPEITGFNYPCWVTPEEMLTCLIFARAHASVLCVRDESKPRWGKEKVSGIHPPTCFLFFNAHYIKRPIMLTSICHTLCSTTQRACFISCYFEPQPSLSSLN